MEIIDTKVDKVEHLLYSKYSFYARGPNEVYK